MGRCIDATSSNSSWNCWNFVFFFFYNISSFITIKLFSEFMFFGLFFLTKFNSQFKSPSCNIFFFWLCRWWCFVRVAAESLQRRFLNAPQTGLKLFFSSLRLRPLFTTLTECLCIIYWRLLRTAQPGGERRSERRVSESTSSLWQSCGKYCVSCLLRNCFGNWLALTPWPGDCRTRSGLCERVLQWV